MRSVQRLPLPEHADAAWATDEYMRWLPQFMWPFLAVHVDGPVVSFRVRGLGLVLLELTHDRRGSRRDRQLLRITGGVLARVDDSVVGRLEFREVLSGSALIAAIHDFRPTLPWYVYNLSQALVHLVVMKGFGWHLARVRAGDTPAPALLPRSVSSPPPRE